MWGFSKEAYAIIKYMKIRRTKSRLKTGISCLIALVCCVGIAYSAYRIIEWEIDSLNTAQQSAEIADNSEVEEVKDDEKTEVIESKDEPPESMYYKYIKMNLLDVDFSDLRRINSDTAGWISLGGTNINYPYVHTTNNDYYLTHSFDKSYNQAGWVFTDFRNKNDGTDKNLILYAHGRYDGTMFGTLKNIMTTGWLNNSDNFIVRTANDSENALWQVFSVYRIPVTTDYIQTSFNSDQQYQDWLNMLKNRSVQDFHTTVSSSDRILTLSTCYNHVQRTVLHAKLIKRRAK